MRIVIIAAVEFGLAGLHCLVQLPAVKVVGVIGSNQPQRYSDYADLCAAAQDYGIAHMATDNINSARVLDWVRQQDAQVIFCLGWSELIKTPLLQATPLGIVGSHPSLLPNNPGRHPLIWAKVLGLKESGLSFFAIDEGADSGALLAQGRFTIDFEDTAHDLYQKMLKLSDQLLPSVVEVLQKQLKAPQISPGLVNTASSKASPKPLNQAAIAGNLWRKRSAKDGHIDWRMSTTAIVNLVRALSPPYPGATFSYGGQSYILWAVTPVPLPDDLDHEPGKVLAIVADKPLIKTYDGCVHLVEVSPQCHLQPLTCMD